MNLNPVRANIIRSLCMAPDQALEYWQLMDIMEAKDLPIDKGAIFVQLNRLRQKMKQAGLADEAIKSLRLRGYMLTIPLGIHSVS